MPVIRKQSGDRFRVGETTVFVLDALEGHVKVGVEMTPESMRLRQDADQTRMPANKERSSYYLFRKDGSRLLVLERRNGQRIRVNETTELVVLEAHKYEVTFAIRPITISPIASEAVQPTENSVQPNTTTQILRFDEPLC